MAVLNFGQPQNGIIQVAFIVEDIQKSMPIYAKQLNIGPWFLFEDFKFARLEHRGQPSDLSIDLCLGFNGHMMYELIEQKNDAPSVYKEMHARRGYGFHHHAVAVLPELYDAKLNAYREAGYEMCLDAEVDVGGRATYVDACDELGGYIELIEVTDIVETLFTEIYRASIDWNGEDPVRTFG